MLCASRRQDLVTGFSKAQVDPEEFSISFPGNAVGPQCDPGGM